MKAIKATMDFIIGLSEEERNASCRLLRIQKKAFDLSATEPETQELNAEIGFFKAVKVGIVKLIPIEGAKKTSSQIDAQLNQLISKSIISD